MQQDNKLNISIPENINISVEEATEILAVSLYKLQKINGVQGGKLLGTNEIDFHGRLEKYGQYVNYDIEDLEQDIVNLKGF